MLIESFVERRHRAVAKQASVLRFLRDENWTNIEVLTQLLKLTKPAVYKTVAKLERDELIRKAYIPELGFHIFGITTLGLLASWSDEESVEPRAIFEPSKVKPLMAHHHLDLQLARLRAEEDGWINWRPESQLPGGLLKRPDAVVTSADGQRTIAIELERTMKTLKRYESIFSAYLQAIKRGEYYGVHYVCPDPVFTKRLDRMFSLIKSVPVAGQRIQITEKHRSKFPVFMMDQWPPKILV